MTETGAKNRSFIDGLPFRSLFLYAWDVADDGAEPIMEWMSAAQLNTLCLASTYHSGWFIHPNNKHHRSLMTEGSVCYFHPNEALYKNTRLRPKVSDFSKNIDWFESVAGKLDGHQLRLVAWTIGTHSTRLGIAYPDLTLQNVYGDHISHGLCPANREVREYLKALCRDLGTNYPLWGLQLESFGWMSFKHGHHHERDLVGLSQLEQELMSYCVCSACVHGGNSAGIDVGKVSQIVKEVLDTAFRGAPQRPKGHPETMAELEDKFLELKKMNEWRKNVVNSLVVQIKNESLKGTRCQLLLQTGFEPSLANVVDGFACASYQKSGFETLTMCRAERDRLPSDWKGLFQCFVQLGMGVPESKVQLKEIIKAVQNGGCNGINFYNFSESPPRMLSWVSEIMNENQS